MSGGYSVFEEWDGVYLAGWILARVSVLNNFPVLAPCPNEDIAHINIEQVCDLPNNHPVERGWQWETLQLLDHVLFDTDELLAFRHSRNQIRCFIMQVEKIVNRLHLISYLRQVGPLLPVSAGRPDQLPV